MTRPQPEITVHDFQVLLNSDQEVLLLDVREPEENSFVKIAGSINIPLQQFHQYVLDNKAELMESENLVVYCRMGGRSAHAVDLLRSEGVEQALNLVGGILEYSDQIDPSLPKY